MEARLTELLLAEERRTVSEWERLCSEKPTNPLVAGRTCESRRAVAADSATVVSSEGSDQSGAAPGADSGPAELAKQEIWQAPLQNDLQQQVNVDLQAQRAFNKAVAQRYDPPDPPSEPESETVSRLEATGDFQFSRRAGAALQTVTFAKTPLLEHLAAVVDHPDLRGRVTVAFAFADDLLPTARGDVFDHRFATPFEKLRATIGVRGIAEQTRAKAYLVIIALMVGSLVLLAVYASHRALVAERLLREEERHFMAAVTHELRSPLASIQLYAEMLEAEVVQSAERARYLKTIALESQRLAKVVDHVLQLERRRFELGELRPLDELLKDLPAQFQGRPGQVRVVLADDVRQLSMPSTALTQILHNLVDNALKFARRDPDDPGRAQECHSRARGGLVEVTARRDGQHAVFCVKDDGPGVSPQLLPHLFEPFRRGEDEFTRETQGTGLGLAIVKQLVSQLHGEVAARNLEQGFVVDVRLPISGK